MIRNIAVWFLWILIAAALAIPPAYVGLIELGARKGSPEAQNELGRWYDQGIWLHASDKTEATFWYSRAAENDYAGAQYNLGLLDEEKRDYQRAAYWYQRAATNNYPPAQNNLAVLYAKGIGVSQDIQKANQWYEKAAQNGNEKAQYSLGIAYAKGKGVAVDHSKAAYWIYQSAKSDFAPAQGYLALLYAQGLGVKQDFDEALIWAKKSLANGNLHATVTIKLIEQLKTN